MTIAELRSWTPPTHRDQARVLRELIGRQVSSVALSPPAATCHAVVLTGGKGGVGKSVLALNLAFALAQNDQRVALVDGNSGLGNLDLLCGLNGYWNLAHVVNGARRLPDVMLTGPANIHLLTGASGLTELAACPPSVTQSLIRQLSEFEADHDFLVVDTGSGVHPLVRQFAAAASSVFIVTTSESTAIADAYSTIKALHQPGGPELGVAINHCPRDQAEMFLERIELTARTFVQASIGLGVSIPSDSIVPESVRRRMPFMQLAPSSAASRAVRGWAEALLRRRGSTADRGFFARLWAALDRSGT